VAEFALPPSDEPPDFRRQAATYARYRRDYSDGLYAAIEVRTGRRPGRRALDVGCGTGLVSAALRERGWGVVGVDFSSPMLGEAKREHGDASPLVRARSEALPLSARRFDLVACGTAFHWFARLAALAEMSRVLVPGGWVALFWRYPKHGEATSRLVREVLARLGPKLPEETFYTHPPEPFAGSAFAALPEMRFDVELAYTAAGFHGYVATTEFLRRVAGPLHARFLGDLREELERRYPSGIVERCCEHLFLGRSPSA
jgi:SAM-dependent methyltransferase